VCSGESDDDDDPELKLAITEIHGYSPKPIGLQEDIMKYWESKKFSIFCAKIDSFRLKVQSVIGIHKKTFVSQIK